MEISPRRLSSVVAPRSACPLYPLRLLRHPGYDIITMLSPHLVPMVVSPPSPPVFSHFFGAVAPTMLSGVPPEPPLLFGLRPILSSLCVGRMAPFFAMCPPPPVGRFLWGFAPMPPSVHPSRVVPKKKPPDWWLFSFIRQWYFRRGLVGVVRHCWRLAPPALHELV